MEKNHFSTAPPPPPPPSRTSPPTLRGLVSRTELQTSPWFTQCNNIAHVMQCWRGREIKAVGGVPPTVLFATAPQWSQIPPMCQTRRGASAVGQYANVGQWMFNFTVHCREDNGIWATSQTPDRVPGCGTPHCDRISQKQHRAKFPYVGLHGLHGFTWALLFSTLQAQRHSIVVTFAVLGLATPTVFFYHLFLHVVASWIAMFAVPELGSNMSTLDRTGQMFSTIA